MHASKKITRICSIYGSPQRDGASSALHDRFLSFCGDASIDRFNTFDMNISACTGCLICSDGAACSISDNMQNLYDSISQADLLTFSFPLYFSSLPGSIKNAVDRCNLLWQRKRLGLYPAQGQQGIFFCTAGSEYREMFAPSSAVLSHLMNSLGGTLRKDLSLCIPGMDSETGRDAYEKIISDSSLFSSRVSSLFQCR